MRRMAVILALLPTAAAITLGASQPAAAHSCGLPSRFDVGKPGNLTIGAAAEARPVNEVDVAVPKGFRVSSVLPSAGWSSATTEGRIVFKGGPITPFTCAFFTVSGEVDKKGVLAFDITTHAPDGTVQRYVSRDPADLYPAQLVLAGVDPDSLVLPSETKGAGGSRGWLVPVGGAVVGVGAGTAILLAVRRRRNAA